MDSFLQQFLNILKVTSHSIFEVFLHVPNEDLVSHLASDLVDGYWDSAGISVLTLAWPSASSADAISHHEVH